LGDSIRIRGEKRFFSDIRTEFKSFIGSSKELSPEYFKNRLIELDSIEPPTKRGRWFDYFIGLLFNQLPNVEVIVGEEVSTGEVDVFVSCLDGPEWLYRLVGESTFIENKWEQDPVETSEISIFHDKTRMAAVGCNTCYFISMSGFSSSGSANLSAEQLISAKSDPDMVGFTREDVERMAAEGTVANQLRNRQM
jgi:hypothetical protein